MKVFIALQLVAAALAISLLSGCTFHVGMDYNGKTGVDNQTISPEFRSTSAKGKY